MATLGEEEPEDKERGGKAAPESGPPQVGGVATRESGHMSGGLGQPGSHLLPQFTYGLMFAQILQISGKIMSTFILKEDTF